MSQWNIKRKGYGEEMRLWEKGSVVYLTFPVLDREEWLLHGFSTRLGGTSQGDLSSMNLSFGRGMKEKESWKITEESVRLSGFRWKTLWLQTRLIRIMSGLYR